MITASLFAILALSSYAYALPGIEATEYTQLLNHEALLREIEKISSLVIEQQKIKKIALYQYRLALTQAKKLSSTQLEDLVKQSLSIDNFIKEISNFEDYLKRYTEIAHRRSSEIYALNIDPQKYIEEEINLANELGGIYERTMNDDITIIHSLGEKTSSLMKDISSIQHIEGPTEGIQILSIQLNNLNHHIKNLEKILLYQDIDRITTRRADNQQKMYAQFIVKNSVNVHKKREKRDYELRNQNLIASWNYLSPTQMDVV